MIKTLLPVAAFHLKWVILTLKYHKFVYISAIFLFTVMLADVVIMDTWERKKLLFNFCENSLW